MSWRVVVYGLAGTCVYVAFIVYLCRAMALNNRSEAEWRRLLQEHAFDLPIEGDDTMRRLERSQWNQEETK